MHYKVEIRHKELGKYRLIKGKDRHVVEQMAKAQLFQWDEMWKKRKSLEEARSKKEKWEITAQGKKKGAIERSQEAVNILKEVDEVLLQSFNVTNKLDWETIKDHSPYPIPEPVLATLQEPSQQPKEEDFKPELGLLDWLFRTKAKKISKSHEAYLTAISSWQETKEKVEANNASLRRNHNTALSSWQENKKSFENDQIAHHKAIDELKARYFANDSEAICEYYDLVLSRSKYPDYFPQQFELEYRPESKTLIVEYVLPHISIIPTLREVTYIQSKDLFKESHLTENLLNKTYDKLLYDITLRTIHEIFESDAVQAINAVAFNGWVHFISPATGKDVDSCILSIHTTRQEFTDINLERVESKVCFKTLKGVGSSKLHSLTPIIPVLQMDRSDKRFITSYEVEKNIQDSTNLAMMDWQDFEHLVREIFEKEFSAVGGEVKVTQSSRDGGVDAVIFDPDPIRGGKIVVQAKRYNNTVGVSSVRDLYGTVMNEGANKGILITTSDYGPDAYNFAKDKPITLLNGGHLLHLLGKHGHVARIDLGEAKKKPAS